MSVSVPGNLWNVRGRWRPLETWCWVIVEFVIQITRRQSLTRPLILTRVIPCYWLLTSNTGIRNCKNEITFIRLSGSYTWAKVSMDTLTVRLRSTISIWTRLYYFKWLRKTFEFFRICSNFHELSRFWTVFHYAHPRTRCHRSEI